MEPDDFKGTTREKLFAFSLQEWFDKRYVLADGTYKLLFAFFIGLTVTILTGFLIGVMALVFKAA